MSALELYKSKGLTEEEAQEAASVTWKINQTFVKDAETLFVEGGHGCYEIASTIPGLSPKELLKLRADLDWDNKRAKQLLSIEQEARNDLPYQKIRALSFLNMYCKNIEKKYKTPMMAHFMNPDREAMPDITELRDYLDTLKRMDEMMNPKDKAQGAAVNGNALVSITVNNTGKEKEVVEVTSEEVEAYLIAKMSESKKPPE